MVVGRLDAIPCLERAQQRDASAGQDGLFDRGAGGMERIISHILLLYLDLGRVAGADHRYTTGELGKPLLELPSVIVGGRLIALLANLRNACVYIALGADVVDDRGVALVDSDVLGSASM